MLNAQCPMLNAQCSMLDVHFSMPAGVRLHTDVIRTRPADCYP